MVNGPTSPAQLSGLRLILQDTSGGRVRLTLEHPHETNPEEFPEFQLTNPASEVDIREIVWYLDEYLRFPLGAAEARAEKAARRMRQLGEELYAAAIGASPRGNEVDARLREAVRVSPGRVEIRIRAGGKEAIAIPWELMRLPGDERPLAIRVQTFSREAATESPSISLPGSGPIRILLIIARPDDPNDLPFPVEGQAILDVARASGGRIEVDLLRPATLEALVEKLESVSEPYTVIHFDCHGSLQPARSIDPARPRGSIGALHLEDGKGGLRPVICTDLAASIGPRKGVLFVINACSAARESADDPVPSLASQLSRLSTRGVIAFDHTVHPAAVLRSTRALYAGLAQGLTIGESTRLARNALYENPKRETPFGQFATDDWAGLRLFLNGENRPLVESRDERLQAPKVGTPSLRTSGGPQPIPQGPRFAFVGRTLTFLLLERVLGSSGPQVAVLNGIGGIGKSTTAVEFAKWHRETGGCEEVSYASFDQLTSFEGVVRSIVGEDRAIDQLTREQQEGVLAEALRTRRLLLVWDNFEYVYGYPDGAKPRLSQEDRNSLKSVARAMRGSGSKLLVLSRKESEPELGAEYGRIGLLPLVAQDAAILAHSIGEREGLDLTRLAGKDFSELLALVDGHPRTLELAVLALKTATTGEVLEGIQHARPGSPVGDATFDFVLSRLSDDTRRVLPVLSFFRRYFVLPTIESCLAVNAGFREELRAICPILADFQSWEKSLREAARAGIVYGWSEKVFRLHPTLQGQLAASASGLLDAESLRGAERAIARAYAPWAHAAKETIQTSSGQAARRFAELVDLELANAEQSVFTNLANAEYGHAMFISIFLSFLLDARGRHWDWAGVRERCLEVLGRDLAEGPEEKVYLRALLLVDQAQELTAIGKVTEASAILTTVKNLLESGAFKPVPASLLSEVYHGLGNVGEVGRDWNTALHWYSRSLEAAKRVPDEVMVAHNHFQIASAHLENHRLDLAEKGYVAAAESYLKSGRPLDVAKVCHQLGILYQEREQFSPALEMYRKAAKTYLEMGFKVNAARSLHQLAILEQQAGDLDKADETLQFCAGIRHKAGIPRELAMDYFQLGLGELLRGNLEASEEWTRKSIALAEPGGFHDQLGVQFHQLGGIEGRKGNWTKALEHHLRSKEEFEKASMTWDVADELAMLSIVSGEMGDEAHATAYWSEAKTMLSQQKRAIPAGPASLRQNNALRRTDSS